jgi:beta-glucosidase
MKKYFYFFILIIVLFSCAKQVKRLNLPIQDEFSNSIYRNPNFPVEKRVEDLLSKMTVEEKIGQMLQINVGNLITFDDITKYGLGALLNAANEVPEINNTAKTWVNLLNTYQEKALNTRLKIPVLYAIDAVHGNALVDKTVVFPHNIAMGCTNDPELIEKAGRIIASEVAGCGIHWTFAPCVAVARDERWGRTYESFSENPELVKTMAEAYIKGLQGNNFTEKPFVLTSAKHFLGDGGTLGGVDRGDLQLDMDTIRKIHLPGYIGAIKSGAGTIMPSYSSVNGIKMHANKYLLTDVLKKELGFNGFLISDFNAVNLLQLTNEENISTAINAGIDMIMTAVDYPGTFRTFVKVVNDKKIPIKRIDDAVRRILTIKFKMGLFENPYFDEGLTDKVGSKEHKDIARQCVRESTVLLKNENKILPLKKDIKKILVCGKSAHNLGYQCGGWTLTWQGEKKTYRSGTTILDGIKQAVSKNTKVTYSIDGKNAQDADVIVAVFGEETNYAEWFGDRSTLNLDYRDMETLKEIKKLNKPIVVVLITARPLIVTDYLKDFDALLVAWTPGTEGEGVSDVIFGDYNPTGRLSFTWPKSMDQIPINIGDKNYDPLYPYGYGLSY